MEVAHRTDRAATQGSGPSRLSSKDQSALVNSIVGSKKNFSFGGHPAALTMNKKVTDRDAQYRK